MHAEFPAKDAAEWPPMTHEALARASAGGGAAVSQARLPRGRLLSVPVVVIRDPRSPPARIPQGSGPLPGFLALSVSVQMCSLGAMRPCTS